MITEKTLAELSALPPEDQERAVRRLILHLASAPAEEQDAAIRFFEQHPDPRWRDAPALLKDALTAMRLMGLAR